MDGQKEEGLEYPGENILFKATPLDFFQVHPLTEYLINLGALSF